MASSKYSLVKIQDEEQEIDLQFQDFGNSQSYPRDEPSSSTNKDQSYYSSFHEQTEDTDKLLGDEESSEEAPKAVHSFWTFEYYQQFFNVESKQVGDRIIWSMIPKPGVNYLKTYIRPNPDLYGPFWICVTLIFTTAIAGNLSNYLQTPDTYKWKYEFHKVTLATTCIFSYAWLLPLIMYGVLLWRGSKTTLSLLDLVCLYGYSLAIFVPVSLLWMIPLEWLQWCLGIVASVLSGGVLVRTFLPSLSHESKRISVAVAAAVLILHAALALGFMLYFFYPASNSLRTSEGVAVNSNLTANAPVGGAADTVALNETLVKAAINQKGPAVKVDKPESISKRANDDENSDESADERESKIVIKKPSDADQKEAKKLKKTSFIDQRKPEINKNEVKISRKIDKTHKNEAKHLNGGNDVDKKSLKEVLKKKLSSSFVSKNSNSSHPIGPVDKAKLISDIHN